eukprot:4078416-Amphidinium_carterae.1
MKCPTKTGSSHSPELRPINWQEAAGAARGPQLEAHEAASAVAQEEEEEYVDDVYGTLLRPELVRAARQLELDWIKSRE